MSQTERVSVEANLENGITERGQTLFREEREMAKKIRRPYVINGVKCWISGDSEQDILDAALKLCSSSFEKSRPREKHNFERYALNWFENFSRPNVSTVTRVTYERQLRLYILPVLGALDIEDVTLSDVQRVFNRIDGAKETKLKCKVVLNMIFKLAIDEDIIVKNPLNASSFRLRGASSRVTPPYSVREMQYLVHHICDLTNPNDIAYMALHALHPLRLEEVLGLKWGDIDVEEMTIYIRRAVTHPTRNRAEIKTTKTDEEREVSLTKSALRYLKLIPRGQPNEFVIGGERPFSYTQLRRMCERIARETGFDGKITPRRFRTTVLTDIYEQTRDIKLTQMAAGHRTPDMTLKHYVKGRNGKRDPAAAIDRIYGE